MPYLVPGPPSCPEVVAVSYIRLAEVPTLFSVEGGAQVEQQNTVVGFLTIYACFVNSERLSSLGQQAHFFVVIDSDSFWGVIYGTDRSLGW